MSGIEFDPTSIIVVAACLVAFVVQLLLCLRSRRVWVRLIPVVLSVLVAAVFFGMIYLSEGWDVIGYLLLAIIASFPAATCVFAWLVFGIICIFRKKRTQ